MREMNESHDCVGLSDTMIRACHAYSAVVHPGSRRAIGYLYGTGILPDIIVRLSITLLILSRRYINIRQ